jgi:hypothetical protein
LTVKGPIRVLCAAALVGALIFAVPGVAGAASSSTTCTDTLAPGTYHRVVVPNGAVCLSNGPVTIKGGLIIQAGATFVLGSEENPVSTGTISGGVHATDAASVQIHFARINGGISIHGGSGPFGGPFEVTFNAIEDNRINGGATVENYNGFWFGFIRNHVNGTVNLNDNIVADPDGNEYVTNVIHGSLRCQGNSPAAQVGDSGGSPNQVTGVKSGQCSTL